MMIKCSPSLVRSAFFALTMFGGTLVAACKEQAQSYNMSDVAAETEPRLGLQTKAALADAMNASGLCEKTVRDYAIYRDKGPIEAYLSLFAKDGTFTLGPNILTGHDALAARYEATNAAAHWRHDMGDIRISDDLTGTSRFTVYTGPKIDGKAGPAVPNRQILGQYEDVFKVTDGVCLIQSRFVKIEMDFNL